MEARDLNQIDEYYTCMHVYDWNRSAIPLEVYRDQSEPAQSQVSRRENREVSSNEKKGLNCCSHFGDWKFTSRFHQNRLSKC